MTRRHWLSAFAFAPLAPLAPARAEATPVPPMKPLVPPDLDEEETPHAMLLPVDVARHPYGWTKLVYPPVTLDPGRAGAQLVQLCCRAIAVMGSAPRLNVLPADGRDGKVDVLVTEAGFFPFDTSETMPAYATYRMENLTDRPVTYTLKLWVRDDGPGGHSYN